MRDYPTPPPWIADLPRMAYQDLPALAQLPWESGQPVVGDLCGQRATTLSYRSRCHLCGYPLGPRVYVIFTEPANGYQFPGPLFSGKAQLHRSCALYSAIVCPHLRHSTSIVKRHRPDRTLRVIRGQACVAEFNKQGVFYPPSPWLPKEAFPMPTRIWVGYFDLGEVLPLDECAARYDAAVAADAELNFTAAARLYWTDSPGDQQRLAVMYQRAGQRVRAALTPAFGEPIPRVRVGTCTYQMALLTPTLPDPRRVGAPTLAAARHDPGAPYSTGACRDPNPPEPHRPPYTAPLAPSNHPAADEQPPRSAAGLPPHPSRDWDQHRDGATDIPAHHEPSTVLTTSRVASGAQPAGGDAGGGGTASS